jgi:hypothetical protein
VTGSGLNAPLVACTSPAPSASGPSQTVVAVRCVVVMALLEWGMFRLSCCGSSSGVAVSVLQIVYPVMRDNHESN